MLQQLLDQTRHVSSHCLVKDCGNRNSGVCEWQVVLKKHLQWYYGDFVAICSVYLIPVSLSWRFVGSPTSVSSVYCLLWERTQRLLLHRATFWYSGVSQRALQNGIEGSGCVEPKLEQDRSATKRLERICKYLSYITDQCRVRTLCGHVNFVVGSGNPTNVRGMRGVRATRLNRNRALGGQIRVLARSVECGSVNRARLGRAILAVCVMVVE